MNCESRNGPDPVILSWSGGKDSALALARLRADPGVTVVGLLTTVNSTYDRISIHGVRRSLLHEQARSLGLPVYEVDLEPVSSNEAYESAFCGTVQRIKDQRPEVRALAFGDIFLEDVRRYREELAHRLGLRAQFPLWNEATDSLAAAVIQSGIVTRLVCVDTQVMPAAFAGRMYDMALIAEFPDGIDPCGENGEFHTFASDGPGFRTPVEYQVGNTVLREKRFAYCDLL